MKRPPNYMLFRKPRTRAIRAINNIFVITGIARNAVEDARHTLQAERGSKIRFPIPSTQGDEVVVARNRRKILSLLEQAVERDFFSQALVPAVALTESYLTEMLRLILQAYPRKLTVCEKKVDLDLILEADHLHEVLDAVISDQICSAFYASPRKYFTYIEDTLSISIPKSHKESYAEVKATRDIFVHSGGIANALYREKAGTLARANEGEPLPLDEQYFSHAITSMKAIVQNVYEGLLAKYDHSSDLRRRRIRQ